MNKTIEEDQTIIIKPEQDLVRSISNLFRSELYYLLIKSPKELVIDLSGVKKIDSVGLGVIITTHNFLNKKGGKLRVTNMSKNLHEHFINMRLDRHFVIEAAA